MKGDIVLILKEAGLKVTPARREILEIFSAHSEPLSAESVLKKIKGRRVNQVTVYRNLASLEDAGILKRIDLRKSSIHYELAGSSHHHHLTCTSCGAVEDFEPCNIEKITRKALGASSKFRTVREHSLELFSVCKTCENKAGL